MYILNGDQDKAIKIISDKISTHLNDQTHQYLMKFLQLNASVLTIDGLTTIGKLFLSFRASEPIRKFWNLFFDILLEKTSHQDIVQFYSDAMRENSNVPYLHLFEVMHPVLLTNADSDHRHSLSFSRLSYSSTRMNSTVCKRSWTSLHSSTGPTMFCTISPSH